MTRGRRIAAALVAWLAVAGPVAADPVGPRSPAESHSAFDVVPGYVVELVAAEPLVLDPVALCWDSEGRLFVAEMGDYPAGTGGGRIVHLVDSDADGAIDERRVFAAGLPFPNGLMAWRGGLLVTAAPDILFLADTDGDGSADRREVVLTGFNAGNQQLRVNGLSPGPDGWIYAANGRSGGAVTSPLRPGAAAVPIDRHDLRFRPETGQVEAVAGFSQFGIAFDAEGNRFSNWNTAPIRHVVFPLDVALRHPFDAPPADMEVLEDPLRQNRVFPVGAPPTTFNREPTDAFNASCGLSIDRGSRLVPAGCAYVCEPLLNVVHRRELVPKGATFEARRPAGEESREFLASRDPWFRPVFTAIGPDGALWICDFYRRWVEHPDFVRAELREGIEWDEGKDRGRIWRVRPSGEPAGVASAARPLESPRTTARRLLDSAGERLGEVCRRLAAETDAAVRFEVALAAESLPRADRADVLAAVLSAEPVDPWVDRAALCVVEESAVDVVGRLLAADGVAGRRTGILRALAATCGRREAVAEASALSGVVSENVAGDAGIAILAGWIEGRGGRDGLPERFGGRPREEWRRLALAAASRDSSAAAADAIGLLGLDPSAEATDALLDRLGEPLGADEAIRVFEALRGRDAARVADGILAAWPAASPAVRRGMLAALFRPEGFAERLPSFLAALDAGAVAPGDIDPDARRSLLADGRLAAADRALLESHLGGPASADRSAVVAAVAERMPATGDVPRGRDLFTRHCAGCHRADGLGARVGPDLAAMHAKPREQLLEDILDPNRRLTGEYAAVAVVTTDGDALTGLVSGETSASVSLTRAEGIVETIPRSSIEVLRGTGRSLMPEGFEQAIRPEEFADLIEFLRRRP